MRKMEMGFGVAAGVIGLVIAVLSASGILPYSTRTVEAYPTGVVGVNAIICLAANAVGIAGALLVAKNNILGAVIMAAVMIVIMVFGFPWQSFAAVLFIISFVMAAVPVKTAVQINGLNKEEKLQENR